MELRGFVPNVGESPNVSFRVASPRVEQNGENGSINVCQFVGPSQKSALAHDRRRAERGPFVLWNVDIVSQDLADLGSRALRLGVGRSESRALRFPWLARRRGPNALVAQCASRRRVFAANISRGSGCDDSAALWAATRAELHDVVADCQEVRIVLDENDRVGAVADNVSQRQLETLYIARVEPSGRFIEHEYRPVGAMLRERARDPESLNLTATQRVERTTKRQMRDTKFDQGP